MKPPMKPVDDGLGLKVGDEVTIFSGMDNIEFSKIAKVTRRKGELLGYITEDGTAWHPQGAERAHGRGFSRGRIARKTDAHVELALRRKYLTQILSKRREAWERVPTATLALAAADLERVVEAMLAQEAAEAAAKRAKFITAAAEPVDGR